MYTVKCYEAVWNVVVDCHHAIRACDQISELIDCLSTSLNAQNHRLNALPLYLIESLTAVITGWFECTAVISHRIYNCSYHWLVVFITCTLISLFWSILNIKYWLSYVNVLYLIEIYLLVKSPSSGVHLVAWYRNRHTVYVFIMFRNSVLLAICCNIIMKIKSILLENNIEPC